MFQQLELDYTLGKPHPRAPTDLREVPIMRLFGVNETGEAPLPRLAAPFGPRAG